MSVEHPSLESLFNSEAEHGLRWLKHIKEAFYYSEHLPCSRTEFGSHLSDFCRFDLYLDLIKDARSRKLPYMETKTTVLTILEDVCNNLEKAYSLSKIINEQIVPRLMAYTSASKDAAVRYQTLKYERIRENKSLLDYYETEKKYGPEDIRALIEVGWRYKHTISEL
jgi:hypothetical protein